MTTLRPFRAVDCFGFNNINLDVLTETYDMSYYMHYLARWPEYFVVTEAPGQQLTSYIMGKEEGQGTNWHGHVSAVTVAPEYRRLGYSTLLMHYLEQLSDLHRGYFVDLYVRISNAVAIAMYKRLGYIIYRQVILYYSGEEDAYDMRKALSRDKSKQSMIPLNPLRVSPGEGD